VKERKLVYSSDGGRTCPGCERPVADCTCARGDRPGGDGVVRVARETKGRRGKAVTVVTGVPLGAGELDDLAKRLKTLCGAGGTVKDGRIEIQGDHRDRVVPELEARGWSVKRSGG
jgi:translation initiation factor 1